MALIVVVTLVARLLFVPFWRRVLARGYHPARCLAFVRLTGALAG